MKTEIKKLSDLRPDQEFRFPNGLNRYDVIENSALVVCYRQLTNYSNRVFRCRIEKAKRLTVVHLL